MLSTELNKNVCLSFLPDEFFGMEEKDDPFLHVAKSFCTSESDFTILLWLSISLNDNLNMGQYTEE